MARDQTFDERRRQRELEDEEDDRRRREAKGAAAGKAGRFSKPGAQAFGLDDLSGGGTEKLVELFSRAEPLIEQVNNLYGQYITGVESRPPLERRKQLDQLMMTLQMMAKPTPAYQFRFGTLNQSYLTHKDRWERMCKDLESGKLKRVTGPKRG